MMTVVFGEQPAPELRGPVTPELYRRLFPTGALGRRRGPRRRRSRAAGSRREARGDRARAASTLRPYATRELRRRRRAGLRQPRRPCPTATCRWRPASRSMRPSSTGSSPPSTSRACASSRASRRSNQHLALRGGAGSSCRSAAALFLRARRPLHARDPRDDGGRPRAASTSTTSRRYTFNDVDALGARVDLGPAAVGRGRRRLAHGPLRPGAPRRGFFDYDTRTAAGRPGLRSGQRPESHGELRLRAHPALARTAPIVETTRTALLATLAGRIGAAHDGDGDGGLPHRRRTRSRPARARPSRG